MHKEKFFRVSSGLKSIIGNELITDDFIAVFELVKNSYDAGSKRVDVLFENIYGENPKIYIKDDGKGMDSIDISKKWLFVAYSAKKEGEEDNEKRKKTGASHYAGSKGIGRFSCDKLGKYLTLYSKKKNKLSFSVLSVDWSKFEESSKKEFVDIPVSYSTETSIPYSLKNGTILEISGLREAWDRDKLLRLKRSLEKLINPNYSVEKKRFRIFLSVPAEAENDKKIVEENTGGSERELPWNVINSEVRNFLFEDLGLKTTKIHTFISENGERITTRLEDRGVLIYELVEENTFKTRFGKLHDIEIHVFALNQVAKSYFTRRMGVRPVNYGSIFLYKNGFRVYPFGESGDDSLKLDRQKQQKGGQYLGSRDVIGRIEINGENPEFQETSSRDGGLVSGLAYESLLEFFTEYAIRRLERFIQKVKKYGLFEGELLDKKLNQNLKQEIFEIIRALSKPSRGAILNIDYDTDFVGVVRKASEKSLKSFLKTFERVAEEGGDERLKKDVNLAQRQLYKLEKERNKIEEFADSQSQARTAAEKAEATAKKAYDTERKKNLFFNKTRGNSEDFNIALVHHIKLTSERLDARVMKLYDDIVHDRFKKDTALKYLEEIKRSSDKILKLSEIGSLADINFQYATQKADLIRYLSEYIGEIRWVYKDRGIDIFFDSGGLELQRRFSALELSLVIDNLISNSIKSKANKIKFEVKRLRSGVELIVSDNGSGVEIEFQGEIFEPGFTTRRGGSGIGLYAIKQMLDGMKAEIEFSGNNVSLPGASFVIRFV